MFSKFFKARAKRRRDRRHEPTSLSDAMRDSQGPMVRRRGIPRSSQHDIVVESHQRYQKSFRKGG